MFSTEQRRIALEAFIKLDHNYADTIAELGYPHRQTLRNWWNEYRETGEVPLAKHEREPKYPVEMRRKSVEHGLAAGDHFVADVALLLERVALGRVEAEVRTEVGHALGLLQGGPVDVVRHGGFPSRFRRVSPARPLREEGTFDEKTVLSSVVHRN